MCIYSDETYNLLFDLIDIGEIMYNLDGKPNHIPEMSGSYG